MKTISRTLGIALGLALAAGAANAAGDGKALYDRVCFACHATGAAGAPKVGDKAAWAPRIAQGVDTLVAHAVNGYNAMPPKGGCGDCDEAQIRAAIEYMIGQSQ
ncbi:c-type cytochrome [Inmirania thermothiophila]|uniref:Cytochrome c5 n=1 Tax=Inmirania thermothiophila TaxID=1750597 RepID=A0A3N1Y1R9_9GAMM|nr:c-type cytochrome [Inmirania thermothiophila]ROR32775.1 cytochrome c5 [Inmirania thermothiophila]